MMNDDNMIWDVMTYISVGIILLILIGLLAVHTPSLLAIITFLFGYWVRGLNNSK